MGLKVTACETSTFGKDEPAAERSGGVAPETCGKKWYGNTANKCTLGEVQGGFSSTFYCST